MAHNKTTDQPGSKDLQANHKRTRNQEAHDTGKDRPNAEREMTSSNKSKQGPEDDHSTENKTTAELAYERGGHGHSGHSGSRNGSR
ncbi:MULTISPECIES: hypothetical protein [Spirosoma]|uniref:Stress-induced protein n=1 Tax=Spirosoma liriopis TaxID=2937440 RepID=A0ABT0HF84_9BACT|nr:MULTISPECIES: hypothetical protein [Spirosoma]MCK8490816.1 hypothetical protein [Spirosoma liriopis]UHG90202.1 hypothetical protein LQ777_18345 [Spirosoma oryzicola]